MKFRHHEPVKQQNGIVKLLIVVVPIIVVFLVISFFSLYRWYDNNLMPVDANDQTEQTFVIEPGTSVRQIATNLKELGLIKNATAFSWFVGRSDDWQDLQAGTYSISPSESVEMIVMKLADGDVDTSLLTIFPGRRLDQLKDDLVEAGYSLTEVNEALNASYNASILADLPTNANLEGYLFPETYQVTTGDSLTNVIGYALEEFSEIATPQIVKQIRQQGLNLHEAVILSSIIYKEVPDSEDQRRVAGVFYNRLAEGMPLGADATFVYAAAITGEEATPDLDHPYNTRIYGGLPPGPIGNFNASAFMAVANPIESDFLYFVSGDDGNTYFAETLPQHEQNVDEHCIELCRAPITN